MGPHLRRPLQGQDLLVRRPRTCSRSPGLYLGFPRPWQPDGRAAEAVPGPPDQEEEERSPDLVVRDEPLGGVRVGRPLDRLRLAERLGADEEEEAEGRSTCGRRRSRSPGSACSCSSRGRRGQSSRTHTSTRGARKASGKWLEDNYGYGHANTLARPTSSDLLRALQLTNPTSRDRAERATSTATSLGGRSTRGCGSR